MALGPLWPAHFQRIFGCCGSRALPTCFRKAPGVFPLLWTATLLVLRTVPRPSCSVVFAAVAIHDSSHVNHGLLGKGAETAESSPLVDAGKADADGAFFGSVASTARGGAARPQVGNLRRILSQQHDTTDEGKSESEHSVEAPDEFGSVLDTVGKSDSEHSVDAGDGFGSDLGTGGVGSTDGGSYGEESHRYSAGDMSTGSARLSGLGKEDFSVTEHPGTDESLLPVEPPDEDEGEAHSPPAHEHADYGQPLPQDEFLAGEEEVKASDANAEGWSHPETGGGAAGGEEDRWDPDISRHTQRGEPRLEEGFKSMSLQRDDGMETEELDTDRSRKSSRRTRVKSGHGTRKRRCVFAGNAKAMAALLATLGVALLGGGTFALRRRRAPAAPVPKAS